MKPKVAWLLFPLLLLVAVPVAAEQRTLQSDRFIVSYPSQIEGIARSCVVIAEETADTLAPWFGYDFAGKKIVLDLHDESDSSNGAARVLQRYVRIDVRKTRFLWRGETQWLRNVLAHELSHTYTIHVTKPPVYVSAGASASIDEWDGSASVFAEQRLPNWFVEGLAQLGAYKFAADRRDPYREMLLRDAFLTGKLLSLTDMARFERSSRERELVYNQGFAFLLYLMQTYPDTSMARFLRTVRTAGLERGARVVFGSSLNALHRAWVAYLGDRYGGEAAQKGVPETQVLYPQKKYPFTVEASATADGRYVIANWGEDFESFSLYERRNGGLRLVKGDTGMVLKKDPASGTVWFNALVYNPREHEAQFELFRIDGAGGTRRVLEGTRCLAFDVRGGRVVFASYRDGVTRVEQYESGTGERTVLQVLPSDIAVYDIALLETGEFLTTVGDGSRIRLYRAGQSGPSEVWPTFGADIASPVSLGGGRIAFASTLDGTPQLYAAALGSTEWQKLTAVPGGVTGPMSWDPDAGSVVCGVYQAGSLRAARLDAAGGAGRMVSPYPAADARTAAAPRDPLVTGAVRKRVLGDNLRASSRGAALVPSVPIWMVGYGIQDSAIYENGNYIHSLWAGADVLLTESSDILQLEVQARADAYVERGGVTSLHPYLGLFLDADLPVGTLSQTLETYGYSYYVYEDSTQYAVWNRTVLRTETGYSLPLSLHLSTSFAYSYVHNLLWETWYAKEGYAYPPSGDTSVETVSGPLYGRHDLSAGVQFSDSQQTYDPAQLGTAGTYLSLDADGILVSYYDRDLAGVTAKDDPSTGLTLDAYARTTALLAGRKASVTARLRGIGFVLPATIPDDPPPYLYMALGRRGLATGYDSFGPVDAFVQGELELRFNPWYDPFDAVRWYERFSLGLRAEGGVAWLIDQGSLDAGYPLTLEAALRGGFLISPQRVASFYVLVAFPMYDTDFFGTVSDYKVFFGASF